MQPEKPQVHFNQLYRDISKRLASTSEKLDGLRIDHEEGRRTLGGIRERLQQIRAGFDSELELLQEHAEWDKFTIAFFGETNAGKSTVLEALRILFSEEGRQALLDANDRDLRRYEEALQEQIQAVRSALQGAMTAHAERLKAMETAAEALSAIVREESSSRTRTRHLLFATAGAALGAGLCFMTLKLL